MSGYFDEAHRTVGQADSLFAHLIDEENIRIRKRVFMTATERRYQGRSDTILSMDDVEAYGETFDKMTFKEALEQSPPILSDYKIVTMVIGRSEIQRLIDENFLVKPDKGKWDDDIEARTMAALIALRKAMRRYKASHALTFHNSIAKAEAFKESQERFNDAIKGYGKVDCFHVSSKVSTGERKQEIERYRRSKTALITNAKCLTEGVDVPTIDAVLFAETKRSTIDIVQAAGRALRRATDKKMGYVIVPTLVDENDPEAADKAFQDILMTLRAMASSDDRIIDYFRSVSQGKRPAKSDRIVDFVVPDPVKIQLSKFVENIETQSWHRLARLSWRPFPEARKFVHKLRIENLRMWQAYATGRLTSLPVKPADIPSDPQRVYADQGWLGYGDWLGTGAVGTRNRNYRHFVEAREFARTLGLKNFTEWQQYCGGKLDKLPPRPEDIPSNPYSVYADKGWDGWGDWLGTGVKHPGDHEEWRPFLKARDFARSLGLTGAKQWQKYCKGEIQGLPELPDDIPRAPHYSYKDSGWAGYGDWCGTDLTPTYERNYRDFRDARVFARSLKLASSSEWRRYCKGEIPGKKPLPADIPAAPEHIYKNKGWSGYPDWLGINKKSPKQPWRPFPKARRFARNLALKAQKEWAAYCKGELKDHPPKPVDIPRNPDRAYAGKGWSGYGDWLGTGRRFTRRKGWRNFREARAFARSLNLKSAAEWKMYTSGKKKRLPSLPPDIPVKPEAVYKNKGWIS